MVEGRVAAEPQYEVIIVGAGVCGIYQLYRLLELGVSTTVLESGDDLGGTWYWNRYPGARFDSESVTYGYSFSAELLQEWDWKERFSGQPENHRYLSHVADKFDLRRHMQFGCTVESAHFDDEATMWRLDLDDGRQLTSRFFIPAIGLLSAPTLPRYEGIDTFSGQSFHTYNWPQEPVELTGKRVAVIGTGATGVQVIGEIADKVGELTVFQRRPNWCAPLHNAEISPEEMAEIKARYDEIFATCARTPGGFIHEPDRRPFFEVPREERVAKWEKLYGEPGFGIWLANFRDIFMDEEANAEFSEFIADKIRARVHDPVVAEKLIPKDHGFGVQRVPLETNYYEAYNRPNVHLVDLSETPIERITEQGIRTTERDYEFDIIVYATGFDAVTGAYDRIDIRGVGGQTLRDKWARRAGHVPRHARRRVSQHDHADRAAERLGVDELPAWHRARRELGHRPAPVHVEARLHPRGGDARGRAGMGRPRHQALRHHADAQGAGLVHRVQLQRPGPRAGHDPSSRLQRRHAEVPGQAGGRRRTGLRRSGAPLAPAPTQLHGRR